MDAAMRPLEGFVVLVTGAGGTGIGRGTALAFGAAGAAVAATARRMETAQQVGAEIEAEGGRSLALALDASDSRSCDAGIAATIAAFGRLDVVVHNAAHGLSASQLPIDEVDAAWWDDQGKVSLSGSFYLARAAFPHLRASGRGRLILFTSVWGMAGIDANPAYAVQKAAIRGMTRALAHEWGPDGITVNAISPAAMSGPSVAFFKANPGVKEHLEATIPLRRMGDPRHDVGAAIVAIAGPAGQYITGQTLVVSGGSFNAS